MVADDEDAAVGAEIDDVVAAVSLDSVDAFAVPDDAFSGTRAGTEHVTACSGSGTLEGGGRVPEQAVVAVAALQTVTAAPVGIAAAGHAVTGDVLVVAVFAVDPVVAPALSVTVGVGLGVAHHEVGSVTAVHDVVAAVVLRVTHHVVVATAVQDVRAAALEIPAQDGDVMMGVRGRALVLQRGLPERASQTQATKEKPPVEVL